MDVSNAPTEKPGEFVDPREVDLSPLEVSIHLSRTGDTATFAAGADEAVPSMPPSIGGRRAYLRQMGEGPPRECVLDWSPSFREQLDALQKEKTHEEAAKAIGKTLRDALLGAGWERDELEIAKAIRAQRRARVTFRFSGKELYALPWEVMPIDDAGTTLASAPHVELAYSPPETRTATQALTCSLREGGRIVFAHALGAFDAELHAAHRALLTERTRRAELPLFDGEISIFQPDRDEVERATAERVRARLADGGADRPATVLHVLCHGQAKDRKIVLVWTSGDGTVEVEVSAEVLCNLVRGTAIGLVVLCACYGGKTPALDSPMRSLAEELVRAGVPAVVASRMPLTVDGSRVLTEELYRALLTDGLPLSTAVLRARGALGRRPTTARDAVSLRLFTDGSARAEFPFVFRPYRGLLAFQPQHHRFFFGRAREVNEAVNDLSALVNGDPPKPRLLVITGASGRGKSSFALAGVVPAFADLRPRDKRWIHRIVRPSHGHEALTRAAELPADGSNLLLVIDQFEEVFTALAKGDLAVAKGYVTKIWALATDAEARIAIVGTLRVDHVGKFGEIRLPDGRTFEDVLNDEAHAVRLAKMGRTALRSAVVSPAKRVGIDVDRELADLAVNEVLEAPGGLPLLQHVLDALWAKRQSSGLLLPAYNDLGGVGGALLKRAQEVMRDMEGPEKKAQSTDWRLARYILVQLVATTADASGGTRRVVSRSSLRAQAPAMVRADEKAFDEVLKKLQDARLIVAGVGDNTAAHAEGTGGSEGGSIDDAWVELAHEELIRKWDQLRRWAQEDAPRKETLALIRALLTADGRLEKRTLENLRSTMAAQHIEETDEIRGLFEKSRRADRGHRIRVGIVIAGTIAFVAALIAVSIRARQEKLEADAQKQKADQAGRELKRTNNQLENERCDAGYAARVSAASAHLARGEAGLAAQVLLTTPGDFAAGSRGWIESANRLLAEGLPHRTFRGIRATWSPDGRRFAAIDVETNEIVIRSISEKGLETRLGRPQARLADLAFGADPDTLFSLAENGNWRRWHLDRAADAVSSDSDVRRFPIEEHGGLRLLSGGIVISTGATGTNVFLPGKEAPLHIERSSDYIAASPDGRWLSEGEEAPFGSDEAGLTRIWGLVPAVCPRKAPPCALDDSPGVGPSLFSLDGARHVTWGPDGQTHVRRTDTWEEQLIRGPRLPSMAEMIAKIFDEAEEDDSASGAEETEETAVGDLSSAGLAVPYRPFAEDRTGEVRVFGAEDELTFMDMRRGGVMRSVSASTMAIDRVDVSADGNWALTSSSKAQTTLVWSLTLSADPIALHVGATRPPGKLNGADISASGSHAALAWSKVGTFLWSTKNANAPVPAQLRGVDPQFSPDGARVLTRNDKTLLVHRAEAAPAEAGRTEEISLGSKAIDARWITADRIAAATEDGRVWIVALGAPTTSTAVTGSPDAACAPKKTALAPDGSAAVFVCADQSVRVLRPLGDVAEPIAGSCSSDARSLVKVRGAKIACAGQGGIVWFDLEKQPKSYRLSTEGDAASALTFSDDARYLAAAWPSGTVRVWDLTAPDRGRVEHHAAAEVTALTFSPEGKDLLVGRRDGTIELWPDHAPANRYVFSGVKAPARAAWFVDEKTIWTAHDDGQAHAWSLDAKKLADRLTAANADSLPEDVRRADLGEGAASASGGQKACETRNRRSEP